MVSFVYQPERNIHYHVKLNSILLPMFSNDFWWNRDAFPFDRCWKSIVYINLHETISRTEFSRSQIGENVQPIKTLYRYLHKGELPTILTNHRVAYCWYILLKKSQGRKKWTYHSFFFVRLRLFDITIKWLPVKSFWNQLQNYLSIKGKNIVFQIFTHLLKFLDSVKLPNRLLQLQHLVFNSAQMLLFLNHGKNYSEINDQQRKTLQIVWKKYISKRKYDSIVLHWFNFSEVSIIDLVLVIMLFVIFNMLLLEHHVYFNVLVLVIEDVVVVPILTYSVDKVEWVYDYVVKAELEVCLNQIWSIYVSTKNYFISTSISFSNTWLFE